MKKWLSWLSGNRIYTGGSCLRCSLLGLFGARSPLPLVAMSWGR